MVRANIIVPAPDILLNFVREFVLKAWKKEIDKSHITILDSKTKLQ